MRNKIHDTIFLTGYTTIQKYKHSIFLVCEYPHVAI